MKTRIEELERTAPKAIALRTRDGSLYRYGTDPMNLFAIGMSEIQAGRGQLFDVLRETVEATNCGKLWEVLSVLASGPVANTPGASPSPRKIVTET